MSEVPDRESEPLDRYNVESSKMSLEKFREKI